MKKNIFGAFVIFMITVAILLMFDDLSKQRSQELDQSAQNFEVITNTDYATNELDE